MVWWWWWWDADDRDDDDDDDDLSGLVEKADYKCYYALH